MGVVTLVYASRQSLTPMLRELLGPEAHHLDTWQTWRDHNGSAWVVTVGRIDTDVHVRIKVGSTEWPLLDGALLGDIRHAIVEMLAVTRSAVTS